VNTQTVWFAKRTIVAEFMAETIVMEALNRDAATFRGTLCTSRLRESESINPSWPSFFPQVKREVDV
jgi:hypothetical protein